MVSLATCSLATSLSGTSLGKTMPLCQLSLLFLAWVSANRAQLKRQRVSELERALGDMPEPACPLGSSAQQGGSSADDPFPLLPWALLLAFSGSFVFYLLFAKEQGVTDASMDSDAQLEETLLRDVSGVLHIIRHRLWKIVQDKRKHQQLPQGSH